MALVSNSDLHHDNQQLSSQFSQSEQEVSRVMSCLNTACVKNEKSEDYSKADLKQRVLFFITIFRLAIPAFFRFADVTELM